MSYLLCATPRSGSTLLCGLLESSGVAGHPASYFNPQTLEVYGAEWGVEPRVDEAFVRAARRAGSTPNGVFGGRVMAESMPGLVDDLEHLGPLRWVHLRRDDTVAQAVSWAKSLQTHFWHDGEEVEPGGREPEYDEELIAGLVDRIAQGESAWAEWFGAQGLVPFEVVYEHLAADPVGTAEQVLDHLGLDVPPGRLAVRHRRQADDVNADWVERFRSRRAP